KNKEEEEKKLGNSPSPAATSPITPTAKPADATTQKSESESERESDVRVIARAVYREDNEGYLDPKHPTHIWVIQAPRSADEKVKPKQLTTGRFNEGNILWSKDGSKIYFVSRHVDEPYYDLPRSELYWISSDGGDATQL